jgi:hypothetical protein
MFETDRLPNGWAERLNKMHQALSILCSLSSCSSRYVFFFPLGCSVLFSFSFSQVWVPSQFHVDIFASAGVEPNKIKIVPEPVCEGSLLARCSFTQCFSLPMVLSVDFLYLFFSPPSSGGCRHLQSKCQSFSLSAQV